VIIAKILILVGELNVINVIFQRKIMIIIIIIVIIIKIR